MPHDYYFLYILQNGNIKQQNETTACKYKTKVTKQINWKKALIWYDLQMNINTCIIDIDKGSTTVFFQCILTNTVKHFEKVYLIALYASLRIVL